MGNTEKLPQATSRVIELDSLRALAALNLMLFHYTHVFAVKYGYTSDLGFEFPWGKYGVQLFFMLSGFVNAMTLFRKQDPRAFLQSRLLRILPVYYIVVGLNLLLLQLPPLSQESTWNTGQVLANLTLVPNLLGYPCLEPVTWTLQIEVIFYFVVTSLFAVGAFRYPAITLLSGLLVSLVGGWLLPLGEPGTPYTALELVREILLVDYWPLFAMGIFLQQIRFSEMPISKGIVGIVLALIVFHVIDCHDHNPVVSLGLLGLLTCAAWGRVPVLRWKPLAFVSTISYSLYLLHNNLGSILLHGFNHSGLSPQLSFAFVVPTVIGLAWLSSRFLERPLASLVRGCGNAFSPGGERSAVVLSPVSTQAKT